MICTALYTNAKITVVFLLIADKYNRVDIIVILMLNHDLVSFVLINHYATDIVIVAYWFESVCHRH